MSGNRRRHGTGRNRRHLRFRLPGRKDWQRSWRNLRAARLGLLRFLARSKSTLAGARRGADKRSPAGERGLASDDRREFPKRTGFWSTGEPGASVPGMSAPNRPGARGRIPRAAWRNLGFVYLFVFLAAVGFAMGRLAPQLLVDAPSRLGIGLLRFLDWSTGQMVPLATSFFDGEGDAAKQILETAVPAMAVAKRQGNVELPSAQAMARDLIRSVTNYDLGDPRSFFISGLSSAGAAGGLPGLAARGGPGRDGLSAGPGGARPGGLSNSSDLLRGLPRLPAGEREQEVEPRPGKGEGEGKGERAEEDGGQSFPPPEVPDTGESGANDVRWREARPGLARETAPVQMDPSALWARAIPVEGAKLRKEEATLVRRLADVRWGNRPLVAIYHSHSSETYHGRNAHPMGKKDDRLDYAWGQTTGVIAAGDELAYILTTKYKVPVVHSRNIHDFPLIREAYSNSLQTAARILRQYPSVLALFDLHRDGLLIAPDSEIAAVIGGIPVARVKIVVGKGRPDFPNAHWQKNMEFAEQIQAVMEKRYPGLSRGIQVREWPFNQQVHERALLFEIGDHFNTKEEALRSAVLLADVLAEVLAEMVQKQTPTMLRHS